MSALSRLIDSQAASRLWARDTTLFSVASNPDVRAAILNRLGWLDAPAAMRAHLDEVRSVARDVAADGLTHLCLLGMGGSSLCAEVLRMSLAAPEAASRLHVLDTTDERAVRTIADTLDPASTLFIVASKSGSTIEVTALEAFYREWVRGAGISTPGRHFIAITDPDTALQAHAATHAYRHTFINPADIGGRFSALSLFGLVPAALLGIDPALLLDGADPIVAGARRDDDDNAPMALGAYMAEHALAGRDKLTILLPASLAPLGLWIEQLVAESTGKHGVGVLPIVDEPLGTAGDYARDRAFVVVDDGTGGQEAVRQSLVSAGHPVLSWTASPTGIGGEFFRWEFATAVAGIVLDVNPFDEPNVRDAKARTTSLLSALPLTVTPPLVLRHGVWSRAHTPGVDDRAGGFIAILDYLPADDRRAGVIAHVRRTLRARTTAATTYGAGPRYLHSTGQYHKGGTNNGFFLLLTGADATATPVPGQPYTFATLKHAQALGDYDALCANGRHVIHLHVNDPHADFSQALASLIDVALGAEHHD
jgi:glucose-6-phosphate isomerase